MSTLPDIGNEFEVAECEIEWHDTPPHGKKKCHSLHATVITVTHNQYVQINTSIPGKVIAASSGHKSSKALRCSGALHRIQYHYYVLM